MNSHTITIDTDVFRSALIPAACVLTSLAVLLGIPGVVLLFDTAYSEYLLQDMLLGGITSSDALTTWTIINSAITVISFLCPAITTAGLLVILRRRYAQGLMFCSSAVNWLIRIMNVVGIVLLVVLVGRLIGYILSSLTVNEGLYLIYTMLISEALMVVITAFLFFRLRRFLNDLCDTTASMAYTLSSGRVDNVPMPALASTGFAVISLVCLILSLDRMFTLTVVSDYLQSYYQLLVADRPGQILAAGCLAANGCASLLLSVYLKRYKRICDRVRMENRRKLGEN